MSSMLRRIQFDESLIPKVQNFSCGDEPWEREVSDWLKSPIEKQGAAYDVTEGCGVWLYATEDGELVGCGSFGEASIRWPRNKDPKIAASIIPFLGVDRRFHGQPPGPKAERYSSQILSDLVNMACLHKHERPILILYVNEQNAKAIAWYKQFNFVEFGSPYRDPTSGLVNKKLALRL